jgi:hypothetical protein
MYSGKRVNGGRYSSQAICCFAVGYHGLAGLTLNLPNRVHNTGGYFCAADVDSDEDALLHA